MALKSTGERLVSGNVKNASEYIQLLRHIFPYEYVVKEAKSLNGGLTALEVGFGEGYGSPMLAEVCDKVVGIDVEESAVAHAKSEYESDKLSFMMYDGSNIPFDDNHFDILVSFQVIEHVQNDAGFVAELYRVLKPGGRLYITTPNRLTRIKPGQKLFNRYHIREYTPGELKALLETRFEKVAMMGVSGTEEIHQLEANRVKQGFLISTVSKLGIRKLVPVWLDVVLARMVASTRIKSDEDYEGKYSMDDWRAETVLVDESLDLFGVCVKKPE